MGSRRQEKVLLLFYLANYDIFLQTVEAQNVHDRINLLKDAIQDVKEKYAAGWFNSFPLS